MGQDTGISTGVNAETSASASPAATTLGNLSGAAFPDPVPTVDLTPAQRERAIDIIAEMHATFSEKVRELAADELADLLGIDRAAWRDKWTERVMEQMRSVGCTCEKDQSGCKIHGELAVHGHA